MSTFVRLTLIGLYNHTPDLFDLVSLPTAYNKDTFIDTLLLDHGEKRVAYPEPEFFKYAAGVWSRKWAASLERIALALSSEYNPIHNYDRYEEWEEHEKGDYTNRLEKGGQDVFTRDGTVTTTETGSTTTTETGSTTTTETGSTTTTETGTVTTANAGTVTTQETGTTTETTTDMTTERTVSAFNENGYQPDEKSVVNGTVTRTPNTTQTVTPNTTETVTPDTTQTVTPDTTQTVTPNTTQTVTPDTTQTIAPETTDTTNFGGTEDGSGDDRRDRTHKAHLYGNIGVTTSQQMIEAEIDLRQNKNLYAIAAELFADDLLLMLY